jgi:selenocysteine-specific elongation factor
MISSTRRSVLSAAIMVLFLVVSTNAFMQPKTTTTTTVTTTTPTRTVSTPTSMNVFNKKKKVEEDLSFIETRDMTREEMLELNKKNEDIMNMELQAMTAFSLILSLPILYLCWVAFFSD